MNAMTTTRPASSRTKLAKKVQAGDIEVVNTLRIKIDCALEYELSDVCDFIFMIQVANSTGHHLVEEQLLIEPEAPASVYRAFIDAQSGNRFLRVRAESGLLKLSYRATVDRLVEAPALNAREVPVQDIPDHVLHYLMPTRYCESDHLGPVALKLFGDLPRGYGRVQAIADWVHDNVDYRIGSSNAMTTARDVFVQRAGVCRDFAHLAVAFCRALNIPARLVCGYAHFSTPPPDFHAIFEAYLDGRWILFDPTGMTSVHHVVRVATGRDAKDVAFATIFGPAQMRAMSPEVTLTSHEVTQQKTALPDLNRIAAAVQPERKPAKKANKPDKHLAQRLVRSSVTAAQAQARKPRKTN